MTNLWAPWYSTVTERQPYNINGDDETYRMGAEWLSGMDVADWGCGLGWMREYIPMNRYHGIDGTDSPFADTVADLVSYRRRSEGIFMRHVLEHSEKWKLILNGALHCFQKRFFLVLYTPLVEETHVHLTEPTLNVPEIWFHLDDITDIIGLIPHQVETVGTETVIKVWR